MKKQAALQRQKPVSKRWLDLSEQGSALDKWIVCRFFVGMLILVVI